MKLLRCYSSALPSELVPRVEKRYNDDTLLGE